MVAKLIHLLSAYPYPQTLVLILEKVTVNLGDGGHGQLIHNDATRLAPNIRHWHFNVRRTAGVPPPDSGYQQGKVLGPSPTAQARK